MSRDHILFASKEKLNQQVAEMLNDAVQNWGLKVTRYGIKDIRPADGS
ncbi:MAG: hypothetical protein D3925_15860 [Candidatus Electrothrix sp. AR5]|nr:hypothetical protein [Candidatus Electrothrix sp. AR5]MCI5138525.1 hypothetical protein [Candidatus Electrothrix sp. AR1]